MNPRLERGMTFRTAPVESYRGAILRLTPASDLQDRWDVAQAALDRADRLGAYLMLVGIGLELGFSGQAIDWWRQTGSQTGLWQIAWKGAEAPRTTFVVDTALSELRDLAAIAASSPASAPEDHPRAMAAAAPGIGKVVACAEGLTATMSAFTAHSVPDLGRLELAWEHGFDGIGSLDVRHYVDQPDHYLMLVAALQQLRRRFAIMREFARPSHGSIALVTAVGRLDPASLGPWLINLPRLVRRDEDLLLWPWMTAQNTLPSETLPAWCLLTTTTARADAWKRTADQFARYGFTDALTGMLGRMVRLPLLDDDGYAVNHLRDACLANGLPVAAIEAQRVVVAMRPSDVNERLILADMLALQGEEIAASAMLGEMALTDPSDSGVAARRAAIGGDQIRAYVATHGFFGDREHGAQRRRGMGIDSAPVTLAGAI